MKRGNLIYKRLYTISNRSTIDGVEVPVSRTKKFPQHTVRFEADVENIVLILAIVSLGVHYGPVNSN